MNTEELVEAYINLRNAREKLLTQYETEDEKLTAEMALLEKSLLNICNSVNADSIKTAHGTVMRRLNERYFCQDWDNFYKYVLDNEAVQLLERRIHQTNFKEHLREYEGDGLPPGVNVMREFGVTVRKSSKE